MRDKREFFDRLEELANEVPEEEWEEAARTPCSDEVWSLTRDVLTQTLQKVFPEGKKRWPEWMVEAREWRVRLLDKRRDLRGQEGGEFETVQRLLKDVSSLLEEVREKVDEQRTAELEEEMSEAWRNSQFALLHALRVEYARNVRGPKTTMLLLATHSLEPRELNQRNGETCFRRRDEVLGAGLGNELQQLRETVQRDGKRRIARRLECCNCSGTGQSSDFEVREKSTKKKSLPSLENSC